MINPIYLKKKCKRKYTQHQENSAQTRHDKIIKMSRQNAKLALLFVKK